MFIISVTYKADLAEVDRHLEAHRAWLATGIADGWILAAGRKAPRTGGVILARGERADIEARASTDPFFLNAVSDFEIVELAVTLTAPGLELLKS